MTKERISESDDMITDTFKTEMKREKRPKYQRADVTKDVTSM